VLQRPSRNAAPSGYPQIRFQNRRDGHDHGRSGKGRHAASRLDEDDQVPGWPRVRVQERSRVMLRAWLCIAAVVLLVGCGRTPQAKAPCPGCSVDGKTTPRVADGHPDLNGYWNGAPREPGKAAKKSPAGFGFVGGVFERDSDGSIIYDPSTEYNSENG